MMGARLHARWRWIVALGALLSTTNCAGQNEGLFDGNIDGGPCHRSTECEPMGLVCVRWTCGRPPGCTETADCPENMICASRQCRVPTGHCTATGDLAQQCYPRAACVVDPARPTGFCSIVPRGELPAIRAPEAIRLQGPTELTPIMPGDSFTLRWEPRRPSGSGVNVTVAMIMTDLPAIDVARNRITNPQGIRWIWSSALPGPGSTDGLVRLQDGHAGVDAEGRFRESWGSRPLPEGVYVWFVFTVQQGTVAAASQVARLRVGAVPACHAGLMDYHRCTSAAECVDTVEFPELADCATENSQKRCVRRCASDLDCCGAESFCDFENLPELDQATRRLGICRPPRSGP